MISEASPASTVCAGPVSYSVYRDTVSPVGVTPDVAVAGLIAGTAMGLVGAIPPGIRCLRPPLPEALRSAG